ncbi:hypothetical protein Tco_0569754 [Tanacetum coccineum]
MLHELGEVNPTRAYYNGSCTSKDTEDPSWSTSFKTRRTRKTSSALEALWKTLFVLYLYMIGTLYGYIKNHKKTVKNGQARTRERKSAQKPEAKPRKVKTSVKQARKAHKDVGFALNTLTQQAQMSLKRIASLAIRVRSFSDPTAQNVDPMIGEIEGMRLRGACRDSRA